MENYWTESWKACQGESLLPLPCLPESFSILVFLLTLPPGL